MSADNPFDDAATPDAPALDLSDPAPDAAALVEKAVTAPVEKKAKAAPVEKVRRTKAEKLADDLEAAEALLSENGFYVAPRSEESPDATEPTEGSTEDVDFAPAVEKHGVLSAVSGIVSATVDANAVAVPVLRISMVGWVGTAPLELAASSISDVRKVLNDLEDQAR